MIRFFDFFASLLGIVLLSPVFILISLAIIISSGFPVFFKQERIGYKGKKFYLLKYRTMREDSHKKGLLTVGSSDSRITPVGLILRKYKLDELPQLFNVLKGEMALVGPRPEVEKYVLLYTDEQRRVLDVKPGITDLASIEYINETDLLAASSDPEKTYIEEVMPDKIRINLEYVDQRSFLKNIRVILMTFAKVFR